jgi:hypothetical protein
MQPHIFTYVRTGKSYKIRKYSSWNSLNPEGLQEVGCAAVPDIIPEPRSVETGDGNQVNAENNDGEKNSELHIRQFGPHAIERSCGEKLGVQKS